MTSCKAKLIKRIQDILKRYKAIKRKQIEDNNLKRKKGVKKNHGNEIWWVKSTLENRYQQPNYYYWILCTMSERIRKFAIQTFHYTICIITLLNKWCIWLNNKFLE